MAPKNELLISINGDPSGVNDALDTVVSRSQKLESGLKKAAAISGAAFVGLSAVIGTTVASFKEQEKVENQLNAVLKSTGSAAGLTAGEIKKMASELQGITTFGDEAIISSSNLLLTFKDIGEDTFPRAQKAVLDMSTAMGVGLKESSIQVGKALNDPVQGISALTRVGIQFTQEQKNTIKALSDVGDKAGAQAIILEELESQFKGQAEAAAEGLGSLNQLSNSFGDLSEELGRVFAPVISNVARILRDFIDVLRNNEQFVKTLAIAIGTGAAGAGLVFGMASLGLVLIKLPALITAVGAGFTFLTGPIGLVALGVAGLIAGFGFLIAKWDEVNSATFAIFGAIADFFGTFVDNISGLFASLGEVIKGALTFNADTIRSGLASITTGVEQAFSLAGRKASERFVSDFSSDLALRKVQAGNALDQIVGKVREFAVKQKEVLVASAKDIFTINKSSNDDVINEGNIKSDTLIDIEQGLSDELIAIDEALADGQISTFRNATSAIVASARERASQLESASGSGGGSRRGSGGGGGQGFGALFDDSEAGRMARRNSVGKFNPFSGRNDLQDFIRGNLPSGVQFAQGFSGRDRIPARVSPGEIIITENFSEGIRRGQFALTAASARGSGGGGRVGVEINLRGDASKFITAGQNRDTSLGTSRGR